MAFNPNDDREFRWWHDGSYDFVVANWHEARRYGLACECENCGVVFSKCDENNGCCPNCSSDYTISLREAWSDLDDPWDDDDVDPSDVEDARITNY